ncbi:MAG: glycosyl hydrolase [Acidobacteriota bacterium]
MSDYRAALHLPLALRCVASQLAVLCALAATTATAQEDPERDPNEIVSPSLLRALDWRSVGPWRGGRSTAVTGHVDFPATYWMGTTGGGVWKTDDAGHSWHNISDGFFGGSIGSIDVADSDPNVIYVGTGSADIRGNTSTGRGVWKTTDGGDTWSFLGLPEAGQIGSIEVDPRDPELVYAAALGHPFGPNEERGLYRSRDGGANWERVLFVSERTGAMDLQINQRNPRELWASMWTAERKPWTMNSGSEEGGIWRSADGGDTWTELTTEELDNGLPDGVVGKIGLAISPVDPKRVWALIEATDPHGGIYRTDDGGASWTRVNRQREVRQRAWYYTHLIASTTDSDTVWALNTRAYKSIDAGKTLELIEVPHGDVHDLWINPENSDLMVVANDGGAQVSLNGGRSWSTYYNQPTAELYDVDVDNAFPYVLYGGQQDNTGIGVPAWMDSNVLHPKMAWVNPGGCETGPITVDPHRPGVTYGGCYGGDISRVDQTTGEFRGILAYPQLQPGAAGKNLKYRFQWVAPILVSRHDPDVVYHASNILLRTRDGGFNWEEASPDLTRDDPEHQDFSGGPIHHDITGVEMFGTIFALAESPSTPGALWAGSDDGRVHITRDDGATWREVTPPGLPTLATIDEIEASVHAPGRALVAAQHYRMDDYAPYIFLTEDWGSSWRLLTDGRNGIPADTPVRTVREDPETPGLLFAGTEFGIYVSFDDGAHWQSLQLDLPLTPVTGLRVHRDDLAVSTQGRSFWVLDDMTPLREMRAEVANADVHLFTPRLAWRANMAGADSEYSPDPPPQGATLHWALSAATAASDAPMKLEIVDAAGAVIRTYEEVEQLEPSGQGTVGDSDTEDEGLPREAGLNRFVWNLQHESPDVPEGDFPEGVQIWGYTDGPKAVPGTYTARLTVGDTVREASFEVQLDPRLNDVTQAQLQEQLDLAVRLRDRMGELFDALRSLRSLRSQLRDAAERAKLAGSEATIGRAEELIGELDAVEAQLIQPGAESNQDLFNLEPQLASNYSQIYGYVTGPDNYGYGGPDRQPSTGSYERFQDLEPQWTAAMEGLQAARESLQAFNQELGAAGVGAVVVEE